MSSNGGGLPAILDLDGTLVDTNYHHTLAWYRAFQRHGSSPAVWRIHRHIGMGGDQLVAAVAGDDVEARSGDAIRDAEKELYKELIGEVEPFKGARDLVVKLKERGSKVVLASSAKDDEVEHYIDLLEVRDLVDDWTSSGDVEKTKPAPDLVESALGKLGAERAVLVGDSTFDIEAAERAGIPTLAVLTGGFSEQELSDAGAARVFRSILSLNELLERSPLSDLVDQR